MRDTLRHHGIEVKTARTLPAFEQGLTAGDAEKPALVIVNIATQGVDWEAAIRQARAIGYPVLAFGSHMDLEARAWRMAASQSTPCVAILTITNAGFSASPAVRPCSNAGNVRAVLTAIP